MVALAATALLACAPEQSRAANVPYSAGTDGAAAVSGKKGFVVEVGFARTPRGWLWGV